MPSKSDCPKCGVRGETLTTGEMQCPSCGNKWEPDSRSFDGGLGF